MRRARVSRKGAAKNAEYAALKREIKARGLLTRRPVDYAGKIALTFAIAAAAVTWIALTRQSALVWVGLPLAVLASAQLTLLGHDACHHAVFGSARANDALALLVINLLNGGSHGWWKKSHDEHHARSNDRDLDPDIDYPFLAFSEDQAALKHPRYLPILRRQHWLVPFMMLFVGINMRLYSAAWLARHHHRRAEIVAALAYYAVTLPLVLGGLGLGRGAIFLLAHNALFGFYVAAATSANHWGMPMPVESHRLDYVRHQVEGSRNIAGEGLVDFLYGGLNRQIEHHLFPTMPRKNLRAARAVVRAFCIERGVTYHEVSALGAYREMYLTMRRVAHSLSPESVTPTQENRTPSC